MKILLTSIFAVGVLLMVQTLVGNDTWIKRSGVEELYGNAEHSPEILLKRGNTTNNINEYFKNAKLHLQKKHADIAAELDDHFVSLRYVFDMENCSLRVAITTQPPNDERPRLWTVQFDSNKTILESSIAYMIMHEPYSY